MIDEDEFCEMVLEGNYDPKQLMYEFDKHVSGCGHRNNPEARFIAKMFDRIRDGIELAQEEQESNNG